VLDSYKIFYIFYELYVLRIFFISSNFTRRVKFEEFITHFALCFVDRLGLPEITIIIIPFDLKKKSVLKRKY